MNIIPNISVISGAGNTFCVIKENTQTEAILNRSEFVKLACKLTGTDGFIFIKSVNPQNYEWDFYNNDGSMAEMCGNATRCVGYYIKNFEKSLEKLWTLKTIAGPIQIQSISNDEFQITMTEIIEKKHLSYFWCDTGVPHIVIELSDFSNFKLQKDKARNLRHDPSFYPTGTNVTYIQFDNDIQNLKAVSYERGVEDFTNACGTGAMAAAYYNLKKRGTSYSLVEMPGGVLKMDLQNIKFPKMTGSAVLISTTDISY